MLPKKLVELQYKYILSTLCLSNIFAIWFVGAVMEQLRYFGYIIKRRMLGVTAQSLVITCMAEFNSEIKIIMFMDIRMCNQVHRFSHLFDLRPPGSSDPTRPLRRLLLRLQKVAVTLYATSSLIKQTLISIGRTIQ